jgi:uncharacterized protein YjbJ (UPF0337 family)
MLSLWSGRMNWAQIQSEWADISGRIQDRWGRVTEEDLRFVHEGRDELIDCIQRRYKIEKDLAERHVDGWLSSFG